MPRRVLHRVFIGSTEGRSYFMRSRLIRTTPDPRYGYNAAGHRLTSSIHSIINGRAGLVSDRAEVEARPGDVIGPFPYNPERPRRHDQDPRRLP